MLRIYAHSPRRDIVFRTFRRKTCFCWWEDVLKLTERVAAPGRFTDGRAETMSRSKRADSVLVDKSLALIDAEDRWDRRKRAPSAVGDLRRSVAFQTRPTQRSTVYINVAVYMSSRAIRPPPLFVLSFQYSSSVAKFTASTSVVISLSYQWINLTSRVYMKINIFNINY